MAEAAGVARPYAKAVFEIAREAQDLDGWSAGLKLLAAIASDPRVVELAKHPEVTHDQLSELVIEVAGGAEIPESARRLVRVLVENDRLLELPEIARQFDLLRAEAQGRIEAEMISARPVDAEQQRKIVAALEQRLGRRVMLKVRVQEDLLGGALIRAGDTVIDGSARGKLTKLAEALTH